MDPARYGEHRQKRPLFVQAYLRKESSDNRLQDDRCEQAYKIIQRWAELESSGKLQTQTESNIEAEFLTQVFGEALGYTLFSEGQTQWNLKPKFRLNDQTADAAIGFFEAHRQIPARAVIELKGPTVNVDRDRFNGRTPVQQCWDYLAEVPECPWGIVSNIVSFRLYHRGQTPRVYQLFTLQELRKRETFLEFYWLFERGGLLPLGIGQAARADVLLEKSEKRQREVGDELYSDYHDNRVRLIQYLTGPAHNKPLDVAIRMAQKLVDRIIFVAFCEDRELLPARSLFRAWKELPAFYRVTNPKWQNFLSLFRSIDEGSPSGDVPAYNGGLFRKDDGVDNLQLDDNWTDFFKSLGDYDFGTEVTVDVLGHLFEKSINDIERIRTAGGLFESKGEEPVAPRMAKSAERKRGGVYYTPPEFTRFITDRTVGLTAHEKIQAVQDKHGIDVSDPEPHKKDGKLKRCVEDAVQALRAIRVVDPACGSGAFLLQAYEVLEDRYMDLVHALEHVDPKGADSLRDRIADYILHDNLFGVDLSPEAVEITQLSLWLRSAQPGKTLADLSKNVVCGNSLVTDPDMDPRAMNWQTTFPQVFTPDRSGFDCVIGNPPWERLKLQEREFFDAVVPEIASAVDAATRRRLIAEIKQTRPGIYERYLQAKADADKMLEYVRASERYPLCGRGDINTYAVFAELARSLVAPTGRVGLLVPSGIATDHTTKAFFGDIVDNDLLTGLYDFENKTPIFPDVHRSYKFSVLLFGGAERKSESADFVFFAHQMEDLEGRDRHISLSKKDLRSLNPNTRTCPIFRSRRDAEITKAIYRRVPVLIDRNRKEGGNPWGIEFVTMFHQTNDAELFHTARQLEEGGFKREGPCWKNRKQVFLPLYEAKMFRPYDHRFGSVYVETKNWMNQGQTYETSLVEHQNPEFSVAPRWWADEQEVLTRMPNRNCRWFLAFRDITRATDSRTVLASFIPYAGAINTSPLIKPQKDTPARLECCLLANLNAVVLDYVARQKVGHIHLNLFIVEQLPLFGPDFYEQRCPWQKKGTLEKWISERVLKLTCVSEDMKPLAEAAGFKPLVHKWDPMERADLMAELDAAFFLLYEIERQDVEYILSTFNGIAKESEGPFSGPTTLERILACYDRLRQEAS
ncbi:MAG: N-6 DNA methylase [Phycisphaerae bacterium]|nr:N-6 DNA methylase [Phycisphaerae bacterium]